MMWELIAANRRKSMYLFIGMFVVLVTTGAFIGNAVTANDGFLLGAIFALIIYGGTVMLTFMGGDTLVLKMSRAQEVDAETYPQLFNVVEEMQLAANLPARPKVYVIDERSPNAFATGLNPEHSAIAVTAGLLARLNRDELQGVVAHEMAHIMNRDTRFMTLAGVMLGSIVLLSRVFLRGMWFSGGSARRHRSGKGGGVGGHPAFFIAAIVLAILGPILAQLMYFAISRKREYLADATAVRLTRYPEGLASALEKIGGSPLTLDVGNPVNAPMFIVNPFKPKAAGASGGTSTHPPITERVEILRAMAGADYLSYQRAYSRRKGKGYHKLIPTSGLKQDQEVPIREAHPESQANAQDSTRGVIDLMRAVNGFAFLACVCGLKIKLPPDFDEPAISCPRCSRQNEIPQATVSDLAQVAAVVGTLVTPAGEVLEETPIASPHPENGENFLQYKRRTDGWESFSCVCGRHTQISPAFSSEQVTCRECGRVTKIV